MPLKRLTALLPGHVMTRSPLDIASRTLELHRFTDYDYDYDYDNDCSRCRRVTKRPKGLNAAEH